MHHQVFPEFNLTSMQYFDWNDETREFEGGYDDDQFTYNANGYLSARISSDYREEYSYEPGNGNAVFFESFLEFLVTGIPNVKSTGNGSEKLHPNFERFIQQFMIQ